MAGHRRGVPGPGGGLRIARNRFDRFVRARQRTVRGLAVTTSSRRAGARMASLDPVARLTTSTGRSRNSSSRSAIRLTSRVLGGGGATRRCWHATWRSLALPVGGMAARPRATPPGHASLIIQLRWPWTGFSPGLVPQCKQRGLMCSAAAAREAAGCPSDCLVSPTGSSPPVRPRRSTPAHRIQQPLRAARLQARRAGPRSVSVVIPVNRRYLTTGLDSTGVPGTGAHWSARARAEDQARPLRTERRCTGISPRTSPLCSTT